MESEVFSLGNESRTAKSQLFVKKSIAWLWVLHEHQEVEEFMLSRVPFLWSIKGLGLRPGDNWYCSELFISLVENMNAS